MEQDEIDIGLRTPAEVRARLIILSAILRRLALEDAALDDTDTLQADAFDEREWLRDQGLVTQLTAREASLLSTLPGTIDLERIVEDSWQGEALVALAWAVRALDMPAVDVPSDPGPVINRMPRPWDAVHDWMNDLTLVSEPDAVRERERAEIWHWRAISEVLRREGTPADRQDVEAAIREVAAEALATRILPVLHDGDFPARGRSVKDLAASDLDELVAVTAQRLRALNWLCGFGDSWDVVPLDV